MGEKVLVLSADSWGMTDEKTGQMLAGVSVWYLNDYREDTDKSFGFKPTKIGCNDQVYAALRNHPLPAYFELSFGAKPGAGNKATLVLNDVKFVGAIDLFPSIKKSA